MTSDIIDFLYARYDEDEQVAQKALGLSPRRWHLSGSSIVARTESGSETVVAPTIWPQEGEHIVRHDPARVLTDLNAKRRVVDVLRGFEPNNEWDTQPDMGLRANNAAGALRALALAYAGHPDYHSDWRPR